MYNNPQLNFLKELLKEKLEKEFTTYNLVPNPEQAGVIKNIKYTLKIIEKLLKQENI